MFDYNRSRVVIAQRAVSGACAASGSSPGGSPHGGNPKTKLSAGDDVGIAIGAVVVVLVALQIGLYVYVTAHCLRLSTWTSACTFLLSDDTAMPIEDPSHTHLPSQAIQCHFFQNAPYLQKV